MDWPSFPGFMVDGFVCIDMSERDSAPESERNTDAIDKPGEIKTIAIEPPEIGTEVTVYYHSNRTDDLTSRTGTLREYSTNSDGDILCLISHSHQRHVTFINFASPTVLSLTNNQHTVLGPLVAMETPEQSLDAESKVATPPMGGIKVFHDGVNFSDEFDERVYLRIEEIQSRLMNIRSGGVFNVEDDEFGVVIPTSRSDFVRAKHRFALARSDDDE